MKYVKFYTLGCKVNLYETQAMQSLFEKNGYICTEDENADVFVINTCTVTSVGDKKSRQMISRAKKKNPSAIIAVTGCYAQVSPDEVRKLPNVDIILGTTERSNIVEYVKQFEGNRIDAVKEKIGADFEEFTSDIQSRTRAMLKIQDGCNNYCSYCIIPYARGPIRSREMSLAVKEAMRLANKGFTEVVLVGIHLSSYGKGKDFTLLNLISEISNIDSIKRIRLGSLEPQIITDDFAQEISKFSKLCHSFHVSMQSGCDETLKRMNRKYTSSEYLQAIERLRAAMPGCAISTDVMVGFPQESEDEFEKSCETVKKAKFADLHVFQYSKRKGTPAAVMEGQIPSAEKAKRSHIMLQIGKEFKEKYCRSFIGKTLEVLFEEEKSGFCEGYTENYIRTSVKCEGLEGHYKNVLIKDYIDGCCVGEIVGGCDA